jgi:hypothetical protein
MIYPSSRTERCERNASSAPIRDLVRQGYASFDEVPDSLAFGSASGMTGRGEQDEVRGRKEEQT